MTSHLLRQAQEGDFAVETNSSLIAAIRLVLAGTVLLAYLIDTPGQVNSHQLTWAVIAAYLVYSVLLFAVPRFNRNPWVSRSVHWVDLAWYGLLTIVTDPAIGGVFLFYFFAILATSFHQGTKAGVAITLASAAVYIAVLSIVTPAQVPEPTTVFLRAFFLVCLGSMIALWGGSELTSKRRLALLRELNALSNPRFGVEQGAARAMTKLCHFFRADACIVVTRDDATGATAMREYGAAASGEAHDIPEELGVVMMQASPERSVLIGEAVSWRGGSGGRLQAWDPAQGRWITTAGAGSVMSELLNAAAWMSVPVRAGSAKARIYLTARHRGFSRSEASFLLQAAEQVFRVIEHVRALDGLASGAAAAERGRIVTDLHDTAIQPYIGLRIGLAALRAQVADTHALAEPIDKMLKMSSAVVQDLRSYLGHLERHQVTRGKLLETTLHDIAARFEEFHGVAVGLDLKPGLEIGDRLAAEVLQIVREGLSNVHRHTRARRCTLSLSCAANSLRIDICNPSDAAAACQRFAPRSLLKRAEALGGSVEVHTASGADTRVSITIPL